jgi:penicillin V acylase-like amidase (Ntn superfamily)
MKKLLLFALMIASILSQNIYACTVISYALNGEVYAAANEDDYMGFARIWFNPKTAERYGSVCFGLPDLQAQAAMNEYGLFYDFTAQNIDPAKYSPKNLYQGDLFFEILGKCKTVKEALVFLEKYDYAISSQVLIADALGNSMIINAGIKLSKSGHYQINTNFDISNLKAKNYVCRRYDIAEASLREAKTINVPFLRDILNRTQARRKIIDHLF